MFLELLHIYLLFETHTHTYARTHTSIIVETFMHVITPSTAKP